MPRKHFSHAVLLLAFLLPVIAFLFSDSTVEAQVVGLLRVHPANPMYFADGNGKPIYLGGHQIFVDLQDNTFDKSTVYNNQTTLDWAWYLQFLKSRQLNYVRNWTEMSTGGARGIVAQPMPYKRVYGYGNANDGGLKFDLTQFDQAFFDRMRSRVIEAGENGIYVSIMLFDVYAFANFADAMWQGNVFNQTNNINRINVDSNGDGWGVEFFTAPTADVWAIQQGYVKKVIDTVGDLDNVFLELSNEAGNLRWHVDMINFVKNYEASRSKRHLVFFSPGGLNGAGTYEGFAYNDVAGSSADVFSVSANWADYKNSPPVNMAAKPAIFDMDHVKAGDNNRAYPWKAFTRGYHFNLYDKPFENPSDEDSVWDITRKNIGAIVNYANKRFSDLSKMLPSTTISSTGYALANPGAEYLIYQPSGGNFSVNLAAETYNYEWFQPSSASVAETGSITASDENQSFIPPFSGDAVLYLKLAADDQAED